ncbi:PTS sugar transporter subunit IIC [Clostridium paraputrificum]|uniref:PTS sugar transporter subunit IIC n=1 Tax=Clostridium paraputrificum TaxID=29363 RepID=UPI000665621A|nr:PTS transporter subunit EIIC [Clostridium paraputrificum]MDB2105911.1 PTS transporter subunit EIIC [Clostridium paraputrificum]MDB2112786.1 PTS transporter subunit EIIC [Clostridium paraputrificum]
MKNFREKMFLYIEKFTSQRHINAIKDGMIAYVPFTIVASIALLVANFPSETYINFVTKMLRCSEPSQWVTKVEYFMDGTMNLASIICILFIAYNLSKNYKEIDPMYSSVISLCTYFLLTPTQSPEIGKTMLAAHFGAKSLIVAIIIGLIVPELYRVLMSKNLKIKLPDSVPPTVANSFATLIPMAIILIVFWVLKLVLQATPYGDIHNLINQILAKPLSALGGSLVGYTIAIFIANLLWAFGIHGSSIVISGALGPILLMNSDANRLAVQAGESIPNIITNEFQTFFGVCGLSICIACIIVGKSSQIKDVSKIALIPAIFGIHEPLVFGLPIMFNPYLGTLYILLHVIGVVLTYIVTSLGFVARLVGTGVPWTTPPLLYGFLATGGRISGVVWQAILLVIYIVISIPFIKAYDRTKLKEEGLLD